MAWLLQTLLQFAERLKAMGNRENMLHITMRGTMLFLLTLAVAMLISGQVLADSPKYGGTLVSAEYLEALGLDPHLETATASKIVFEQIYSGLVRLTDEMAVVPDVASSWEQIDEKTLLFHLRDNVRFHNGRKMTADDVVYSLNRILDPKVGSPWRSRLEPIEKIEALDDFTVRVVTKSPYAPLLTTLAESWAAIVPKEEIEKYGNLRTRPIGTGPFKLGEWVPGSHIKLVKNTDYFMPGRPYLDAILYKTVPDETTRLAMIQTKDAHITRIVSSPQNIAIAKKNEKIRVAELFATRQVVVLNTARKPFDDVRVRQALSYAIDRQALIKAVAWGEGAVTGVIAPGHKRWALPIKELPDMAWRYDPNKAKKLLAEAGYPNGFETTMLVPSNLPIHVSQAEFIQNELRKIGIKLKVDLVEWGIFLSTINKQDRNYDMFIIGWSNAADPDGDTYAYFHSSSVQNYSNFRDPELDSLMERGRRTFDFAKRKRIYEDIQRQIAEKVPAIFLYAEAFVDAMQPSVRGYRQMVNVSRLYYQETWLEE